MAQQCIQYDLTEVLKNVNTWEKSEKISPKFDSGYLFGGK